CFITSPNRFACTSRDAPLTQFVLCRIRSALVCGQQTGVGGPTPVDPNENSNTRRSPGLPRLQISRVRPIRLLSAQRRGRSVAGRNRGPVGRSTHIWEILGSSVWIRQQRTTCVSAT